MLKNYKIINNVLGWLICGIASFVFISTAEPSVSFWDCGEYIATAYKLQVGHPPGAPTFQLIGRIFTLFAGDDVTKVAFCINCMSALCSGFTILFLFWSITMLGRKLALSKEKSELTSSKVLAIFGSGIVGSLAYTFSDTFWFSAVEGEVYAMSSLCTALVFWAILKWDQVANENYSYRWIILIAYIIGLSIGVHLLNLLTLPAMVLVVYFRKYKPSTKGIIWSIIISFVLVGIILWGIVPYIVKFSSLFERLFANSLHTGFYVGTIFYFLLIAGLLVWGLWYSEKKKKKLLNTGLLSLVFILIGYSTFLMLPIRSNANPPIDENDPEDAVALLSYLNREQYGSHPLVYGHYYNTSIINYKDGDPVYVRKYVVTDSTGIIKSFFTKREATLFIENTEEKYGNLEIKERYEIGDPRTNVNYVYDPNQCTFFPRMWNMEDQNVRNYKYWAGISEGDTKIINGREVPNIPTFAQNLKFFFRYQMGYMYVRYFLWNFVGRQTLDQGYGNKQTGEWVSGINFIDEARLGPQDMPAHMKNKGNNKYYFLPLILGLVGLFFQFSRDKKNGLVVMLLFFMTGIAIGIYLNMYAYQPRERDYAFAASFYAFAIWIGLGVYALYNLVKKYIHKTSAAALSTVVCMGIPTIMGVENWDDHDRSNRYLVLETAKAYLNSCAPNAILFAHGDNDTFPLWYLQEVEGFRTDVRICNLSLMSADWYIDQTKRKAYNGEPVPGKMTKEMYQSGTRDLLQANNVLKTPQNIKNVMQEICKPVNNRRVALINTIDFYMNVDKEKVLANGTVSQELSDKIVDRVVWQMPSSAIRQANGNDTIMMISRAYIAMMDILAHNDWERPIYFIGMANNETFFGLQDYFQHEGMLYRLVPVLADDDMAKTFTGRVNTDVLYDDLMNKYNFSQYLDKNIFLSEDFTRPIQRYRLFYFRLAYALMEEGKIDSAETVLDKCYELFPKNVMPFEFSNIYLARTYLECNTPSTIEKGMNYLDMFVDQILEENAYYMRFKGKKAETVQRSLDINRNYLYGINQQCREFMQKLDATYTQKLQAIAAKTSSIEN
ncbi:MAG: DUF2723 domain-containing protein [Bacteroidales bacterium]|jgi:hypothetical protein|nr:DUF2723 domain-containing protein [Bacteroidales bacterium]